MMNDGKDYVTGRMRRGGVLVTMIAVMLVLGILGVSAISLTRSAGESHLAANAGNRAYYLADSALRYAQYIHCNEQWLHGRRQTLNFQGSDRVEIVRVGSNFIATATASPGTAKEGRARVQVPIEFCGEELMFPQARPDLAVFGDNSLALGQRTVIEGAVGVAGGDVDIQSTVDGNVYATDVGLTGAAAIAGDIIAAGEADVTQGIVRGDIHAGGGVRINSAMSEVTGWIFSLGDVTVRGGAWIEGEIHACGGDVDIGGNGTNTGGVYAMGNVYLSGSAVVNGDVHAGGEIMISGSATIKGNAFAAGRIVGGPGAISGERYPGWHPEEPICPDLQVLDELSLPEPAQFTATGSDIVLARGDTLSLPPGNYGHLQLPNNSRGDTRLYLRSGTAQPGNYYFKSVTFGGNTALFLDLSGSGDIRVFVTGAVDIDSGLMIFVSADGSNYQPVTLAAPELAAKVYWEPHGDFNLKSSSEWFGAVYTPFGALDVGNNSYLVGTFFSGGGHAITGSTVIHVAPNYLRAQSEVPSGDSH